MINSRTDAPFISTSTTVNKTLRGSVTLVNGTATVTLGAEDQFVDANSYTVAVSFVVGNGNTEIVGVTNTNGTSFDIVSNDNTSSLVVKWVASGIGN